MDKNPLNGKKVFAVESAKQINKLKYAFRKMLFFTV